MSPVPHYETEITDELLKVKVMESSANSFKDLSPSGSVEDKLDSKTNVSITDNIDVQPKVEQCVSSNVSIVVNGEEHLNGMDLCEEVQCNNATITDCDKTHSDIIVNGDITPSEKISPDSKVLNSDKTPSDISQGDAPPLPRDTSMDTLGEITVSSNLAIIAQMDAEACGCPLEVFVDVSTDCVNNIICLVIINTELKYQKSYSKGLTYKANKFVYVFCCL